MALKVLFLVKEGFGGPGDSLFINCIVEDKDEKLPADHPVRV